MDEKTPERLKFKSLSEGLGFHPFSEGLPYAPVSKRKMGAGAEAAGIARPVPIRSIPRVVQKGSPSAASASRTEALPSASVQQSAQNAAFVTANQVRPQAQVAASQAAPAVVATAQARPSFSPGAEIIQDRWYLFKRATAFCFDLATTLLIFSISLAAFFTFFRANVAQLVTVDTLPSVVFLFAFVHWAFVTLQELIFKTSIGKSAFGLNLKGERFTIFLRAVFSWVSFGLFGAGLLYALFDSRKRALHDVISGLQPQ